MNKVIFWFLIMLAFIIPAASLGTSGSYAGLMCSVLLIPLIMVFANRRRDENKQDELIRAIKKDK